MAPPTTSEDTPIPHSAFLCVCHATSSTIAGAGSHLRESRPCSTAHPLKRPQLDLWAGQRRAVCASHDQMFIGLRPMLEPLASRIAGLPGLGGMPAPSPFRGERLPIGEACPSSPAAAGSSIGGSRGDAERGEPIGSYAFRGRGGGGGSPPMGFLRGEVLASSAGLARWAALPFACMAAVRVTVCSRWLTKKSFLSTASCLISDSEEARILSWKSLRGMHRISSCVIGERHHRALGPASRLSQMHSPGPSVATGSDACPRWRSTLTARGAGCSESGP
mmetsp:Transcript_39629/g.104602  ORF Transcript_39629/g.104602 Transcript_39629/m.104602 type:complete len:277 (+) Transcript_39629:201-1031(+)